MKVLKVVSIILALTLMNACGEEESSDQVVSEKQPIVLASAGPDQAKSIQELIGDIEDLLASGEVREQIISVTTQLDSIEVIDGEITVSYKYCALTDCDQVVDSETNIASTDYSNCTECEFVETYELTEDMLVLEYSPLDGSLNHLSFDLATESDAEIMFQMGHSGAYLIY